MPVISPEEFLKMRAGGGTNKSSESASGVISPEEFLKMRGASKPTAKTTTPEQPGMLSRIKEAISGAGEMVKGAFKSEPAVPAPTPAPQLFSLYPSPDSQFNIPKFVPQPEVPQPQSGLMGDTTISASPEKTFGQKALDVIKFPFTESEQKTADKSAVASQVTDYLNKTNPKNPVSITDVTNNLDDYTKLAKIRSDATPKEAVGGLMNVGLGLAAPEILSTPKLAATFALFSGVDWTKHKITNGQELSDIISNKLNLNDPTRAILNAVELFAEGGLAHSIYKSSPRVTQQIFKQKITEHNLPQTIFVDASKVKDIFQTGKLISPTEKQIIQSLGLTGEQYRHAIANGVSIEIPAEKVVTLVDKPFWSRFKHTLGIEPTPPEVLSRTTAGETRTAPRGYLPEGQPGIVTPPVEALAPKIEAPKVPELPPTVAPVIPAPAPVVAPAPEPVAPPEKKKKVPSTPKVSTPPVEVGTTERITVRPVDTKVVKKQIEDRIAQITKEVAEGGQYKNADQIKQQAKREIDIENRVVKGEDFPVAEPLVTKTQVKDMIEGMGVDRIDFTVTEKNGKKYLSHSNQDGTKVIDITPRSLGLSEVNLKPGHIVEIKKSDFKTAGSTYRGYNEKGEILASKPSGLPSNEELKAMRERNKNFGKALKEEKGKEWNKKYGQSEEEVKRVTKKIAESMIPSKPKSLENDYSFAKENITEDIHSKKAFKETDKIIKRSEIAKELSKKLNVPIRRGKFRMGGAIGVFKGRPKVIRLKSGGLPTTFHEVGHFLDSNFKISRNINRIEAKALMLEYGNGNEYADNPGKQRSEGFAEYLRFIMTGQKAKAARLAPIFDAKFKEIIDGLPEIKAVIDKATNDYRLWEEQPAVAKILSTIAVGEDAKGALSDRISTSLHDLYSNIVEDKHAIGEYTALAERVLGKKLKPEENPYLLARNLKGLVGKSNMFLTQGTFGKKYFETVNGKTKVVFKGKPLDAILKPIENKGDLNKFRAYLVANRVTELAKRFGKRQIAGTEYRDAVEAIDELKKSNPEFEKASEELYKYQNDVMDYAVDYGYISEDIAKQMKGLNKLRVPFYRVMEEVRSSYMGGKKIAGNMPSVIKGIKNAASERDIIDPIESIVKDTYAIINATDKNSIAIAMANLASTNYELGRLFEYVSKPMKPIKVDVAEVLKKALAGTGMDTEDIPIDLGDNMVTLFRPTEDRGPNMLTVNFGDKTRVYQVDPSLFKSLQGLEIEDLGMMTKLFSIPARWLRAGATLSPDFIARNPIRDPIEAFVYSKYGFIPIYDQVRGLFSLFSNADSYKLWKMAGGEHSMMVSMDRTSLQKTTETMMRTTKGEIIHLVKNPLEVLRIVAEWSEQSTRLGEMIRGLEKGADPKAAAFASREVTLDFARIGAKTKAMNALVAFFNPAVQGTDKLIREMKNNPVKTSWKLSLAITLPSILLYLANRDDKRWKEIPQWQKDTSWIIFGKDSIYRIPKPLGVGQIFGSLPERVLEAIDEHDPSRMNEILTFLVSSQVPNLMPTFAGPIVENLTNYSFFRDAPIVPQNVKDLPKEAQYNYNTSEISKLIGTAGNISPLQIDNLIQGYGGTLGTYATKAIDKALTGTGIVSPPPKVEKGLEELPLIKAFMVKPPIGTGSRSVAKIYELESKSVNDKAYLKKLYQTGDTAKAEKFLKENPDVATAPLYTKVVASFTQINKAITAIRNDKNMSPSDKKLKIDELQRTETDIAEKVLKSVQ